jgi:hypothetical protein
MSIAAEERGAAQQALTEVEARQPAATQERDLETAIARLEGRLAQAEEPPAAPERDDLETRTRVVSAARAEAEGRRSEASQALIDSLGQEVADLGRRFGIPNLESARPRLNASLALTIGGAPSNFSSRAPGERLRLRLATVIALLRVGERLGVGRHPGLLLIDSPGGEEMVEGDVAAILGELETVCHELPTLQIVCATARAAQVRNALPEDRIIRGRDYGEVW